MIKACLAFLSFSILGYASASQGIASTQHDTFAHSYPEPLNGTIKGGVTTTDRTGAAAVTAYLKEVGRPTTTDANGHFIPRNIKSGNYILQVTMTRLKPQQTALSLKEGESVVLNLMLEVNQGILRRSL